MGKLWIKETKRKISETITGQKCLCKDFFLKCVL